ncbi:MAG: tRNA-specific 2-thiouridylase MnmA [Syntrophorhabdus sp. PtaU1.Bin058]|nr:MAG: tRNA-specific 2-thiouridylase MnmA [Syntrophorhabdus sp. PtaU1.Bin058]
MNRTGKRIVAVGMSGGVDSTMTALLLQGQGFTVVGLTMRIWDGSVRCETTKSGCYGPGEAQDIADARKIAARLGIEHHVIDLREEYRGTVIEYFRREYAAGRTPNPCVMCNTKIKFGALLEKALSSKIEFDLFATGHYARVVYDPVKQRHLLKRGTDRAKDQSYFLYRLSPEQLGKVMFPLGDYRKDEIKAMAQGSGFEECMKRPESQDFLEWDDYGVLLEHPAQPGDIVDTEGKIIGRHAGTGRYTVGQRRMLNLAGMKEPFYVLRIDAGRNEIVAGPKRLLLSAGLIAGDLRWIIPLSELQDGRLSAQIRYRSIPAECTVSPVEDNTVKVVFGSAQEAVTPGQSVVFYTGDTVAGGGIIREALTEGMLR